MPPVPIRYVDPVFRPPSEADALILPVTDGCSWNRCTFCEMYTAPQKAFRARAEEEVLASIRACGQRHGTRIRRVFLADGDALVLPTRRLLTLLAAIREHLPAVERVASYCLARNLKKKSVAELRTLHAAGLGLAYLGAESGDDEVLARVNKGETQASTRAALDKLGEAGIARSVMILNGLGGQTHWLQHAEQSAALINATQPEFLATLVLTLHDGGQRFRAGWPAWQAPTLTDLFTEMAHFLGGLSLQQTVFRADHASNRLVLKGKLGADKARLLAQVHAALADPIHAPLRPIRTTGL